MKNYEATTKQQSNYHSVVIVLQILLIVIISTPLLAMNGDQENKIQEDALKIQIDYGKDSPEIDELLQDNNLKEEDLDEVELNEDSSDR